MIRTVSFVAAAFCLTACAPAAVTSPKPNFDTAAMDMLLSSAVENGDVVAVSALVFDEGETVYKGAFGLRDKERGEPAELDTVWRIYSMTKPVTSVIIMDLAEEGKLKLSDPASKYIPELAKMQVASTSDDGAVIMTPKTRGMTVEDLLLHRSGIAYGIFGAMNPVEELYEAADLFNPAEDLSVKMQKLSQLPLISQPGDAWYYSYSIDVLGRIAEIVTNQSLGDIMQERIFDPLGMNETGFYVKPEQKSRFASNYYITKDGTFALAEDGQSSPFLNDNAFQSGGGGLVSTLDDYAKFAQMMLDGGIYNGHRVLDENTVNLMMSDNMGENPVFLFPWLGGETNSSFGYGGSVVIKDTPQQIAESGRGVGQWGWSGAARTVFWIDPRNNALGILMLQMFTENDPALHTDFRSLAYKETVNDK